MVCHLGVNLFFVCVVGILREEVTTEAHANVLETAHRRGSDLTVEKESTLREQFSLSLHLLLLLGQSQNLRSVFELFREAQFLQGLVHLLIKFLRCDRLVVSDSFSIEELSHFGFSWRILHTQVRIKFEVHEFEEGEVELFECANNLVVNIEWQTLVERIRCDPCNLLAHDFNLKVNTLDTKEALLECLRDSAICHPLGIQSLTHLDILV